MKEWAISITDKIAQKVSVTAERNRGKIPYTTADGRFDDWSGDPIGWWTNGFFAAQLWLLYHSHKNELFRKEAEAMEEKLEAVLSDPMSMDHDSGFRFLITSGANYRITGSEKSKRRALIAASDMAGRYNAAGRYIRAWNDPGTGENAGLAIIDCMMNLPLLYWASDELHDPRFKHIAVSHANTVQKVFIREDGSAHHIVEFDPETGAVVGARGGQGMAKGSSWTRGQAWALYGFTLSYLHTGDKSYLETAKRSADCFISNITESGFIPVDFCQPSDVVWEDSSAAAIAACGLLELHKATGEEKYYNAAVFLLTTLAEKRCNFDTDTDNILEKCTAAYHDKEHDFPIIYGDYFFTEAVLKLAQKDIMLW